LKFNHPGTGSSSNQRLFLTLEIANMTPAATANDTLSGRWNRFWFAPADPTTLGLIRVCCGVLVLYVHLVYTAHLQGFFGANGWIDLRSANNIRHRTTYFAPPSGWQNNDRADQADGPAGTMVGRGQTVWSIWFHVTDPRTMTLVHGGILVVMVMFTLGLWTRVTAVLTWLAVLSYLHRAPLALFGLDTVMNVVLIYLMIGPSGAALSLDRLLVRYFRRGQSAGAPEPSEPANLAIRLMQIHLCIIYLASGLSKLQGAAWWNGTAIWGTMVDYELSLVRYAWYADALRFVVQHRWLGELVITGGTLFTLVLEIGFPFVVWHRRLRWPMIVGALSLHAGIAVIMGLTAFSFIMMTLVLSFVPPADLRTGAIRVIGSLTRAASRLVLLLGPREAVKVAA
jgi:hypothetical protein